MIKESKEHLKAAQKSYGEHFSFAFKAGWFLIYTGFISIFHGFFPAYFKFQSARNVMALAHTVLARNNEQEFPQEFLETWEFKRRKS